MRRIYMDNAATSFPKPPSVLEAMTRFATELGASPGRGAYAEAREAGRLMEQCRERLNTLFHGEDPSHVIFTLNTSDSLNLGIRGVVGGTSNAKRAHAKACSAGRAASDRPHVITTWLDHNSVLRPFNELARRGDVEQTRVECDPQTGLVDPNDIRKAIGPNTRLVAMVHGSNVTGTLQPIGEIGRICREHDVPFLVDAAQTLGHFPIDVQRDNIDLLAFPGHKGLLGPLGTGGLYIRPGVEKRMVTVREGGTGSISEQDVQPDFLPDRFEPGSHNAIGIIGLSEGVQWILDQGVDNLWRHEQELIRIMIDTLNAAPGSARLSVGHTNEGADTGVTLLGPQTAEHRCGVFSIRVEGYDQPQLLSDLLESEFGILTRSGVHCAPLAHKTIGTHALGGTTRLSFGPFLTPDDVRHAGDAIAAAAHASSHDQLIRSGCH